MEITNKDLKRRLIDISWRHKLSHLGSVLTAVDIIEEIFQTKKRDEKFILSAGHSGLALYVVLEKHYGYNAEELFQQSGVHPDRLATRRFIEGTADGYEYPIDCSTGSLGQGLPIAVGMALADRSKNVYCLVSDGEMAEGSIAEAMSAWNRNGLNNLIIHLNYNGWAAYRETSRDLLNLTSWGIHVHQTTVEQLPFLKNQDAHYYTMTEDDYKEAAKLLS